MTLPTHSGPLDVFASAGTSKGMAPRRQPNALLRSGRLMILEETGILMTLQTSYASGFSGCMAMRFAFEAHCKHPGAIDVPAAGKSTEAQSKWCHVDRSSASRRHLLKLLTAPFPHPQACG
eukprot:g33167.t1